MFIRKSQKTWILTALLILFFYTISVNAESTSFHLSSDNYDHLNQLFEPSDLQPSPLPVHVWVDVTNLSVCQIADSKEIICELDESVALGSEQVRITHPTKQIEAIQLNSDDIQLISKSANTRSGQNSELTYQLQEPVKNLSIQLTTTESATPNTVPNLSISLRRNTVSIECDLIGTANLGSENDGNMGINLGARNFREEQRILETIQGSGIPDTIPRTEILPVNANNLNEIIPELSDLGVDWVRFPIVPMMINGNITWSATLDRYEVQVDNLCDRAGISSLPVLTEKLVAEFDINASTPTGSANSTEDQYANFQNGYLNNVADLAQRLTHVRRWQIWNEPNLENNYFDLDGNNPERRLQQFAELIRLTHETIEDNHSRPNREIVLGGVSDVWRDSGADWLTQLYQQATTDGVSIDNHINYIAVHPYSYSNISNDNNDSNDITRSIDPLVYLQQADVGETGDSPLELISTIVGEIPLSVTEIGWDASETTSEAGIDYGVNQCFYLNQVTGNPNETGTIIPEWLQADFLYDSYRTLLNPNITHYPNRSGDSNVDNTIFWYRFDDIKIQVTEQFQTDCIQQNVNNPQDSLAGAAPIGVANPPTTSLTRNRENETKIPINHWWGLIDEDGNKKSSYCGYMRFAVRQGALDDYTDESCRRSQIPSATTVKVMRFQTNPVWHIILANTFMLLTATILRKKHNGTTKY